MPPFSDTLATLPPLPEPAAALARRLLWQLPVPLRPEIAGVIGFAWRVHRHERREPVPESSPNLPFIVHPLRLALSLVEEARVVRPLPLVAAICHDTLEHDRRLTFTELASATGTKAAELVLALSVPHKLNPGESPAASRVNYLRQVVRAGPGALLVKAADRLDNQRHRFQSGPAERRRVMLRQDREDWLPLFRQHLPPEGAAILRSLELICGM